MAWRPPRIWDGGIHHETYAHLVKRDESRRTRREIARLSESDLDWVTFACRAEQALRRAVAFDRTCWHPVDPGTTLFTGNLAHSMTCDGAWLAHHEYVVPDVNKWAFLARSGYRAGSLRQATHGNLELSARYRSVKGSFGDELRGALVIDGGYWAAAGFFRDPGQPWFDGEEVRFLASLSSLIAEGFRRAILRAPRSAPSDTDDAPGLVIFDDQGGVESVSPSDARWLEQVVEFPSAGSAEQSRVLQAVAARARSVDGDSIGNELPARVRVQTVAGRWLVLDGMRLAGPSGDRVAVMIQPAPAHEIAPLIVAAYGLSERERQITLFCIGGMSTREIAAAMHISPYTVQDHLKSVFEKVGVSSRAELVGKIFLDQYVPRFRETGNLSEGWLAHELTDSASAIS